MCIELTYMNSPSFGYTEFTYLAVGDKVIVDKSIESEDQYNYDYSYEGTALLKFSKDGQTVLTALMTYPDYQDYENSVCKQLVDLQNEDMNDEVLDNLMDMFHDAAYQSGFIGKSFVWELIEKSLVDMNQVSWRLVDFETHRPENDNIHPDYDT